MIIDCHVHITALTPRHGCTSDRLLNSLPFRFMRWRLGISGSPQAMEQALVDRLARIIDQTPQLDAAVILAFDAVYDRDGNPDPARTHIHVTNDYVMEIAARHPKMLFGASVHPYRKDAVAELERCIRGGAVLMKWLPLTQGFSPADERCFPLYEAMAHYGLPLLAHTGWEQALTTLNPETVEPRLLVPALNRGVKVIAAHCGSRSMPWEADFVSQFIRLAREHEHLYGDTAALNLPTRWHAFDPLLNDECVRRKLVHGSDWPIMPVPSPRHLGIGQAIELMADPNWLRRDALIKQRMGFDEAYWRRAGQVLRNPQSTAAG